MGSEHAGKLIDRIKKQTVPGRQLVKGLIEKPKLTGKPSTYDTDITYGLTKFSESPFIKGLSKFAKSNWLVLGEVVVIVIAKLWPKLGCTGGPLKPEFFISKLGVFLIFFLNGMAISMKKDESDKTNTIGKTNMLIQTFNIIFIPLVTKLLATLYPNPSFRDGFLVLSVIPTTINICVAQTLAAGGNMPMVIFNAILSNLMGVFLTPVLVS
jgi:sodium/bile acid cotransporter 7